MNPIKALALPCINSSPASSTAAKTSESTPPPSPAAAAQRARGAVEDTFQRVASKLEDVSETSSQLQFEIQSMMSQVNQTQQQRSNLAKKESDVSNAVISKIRG